MVEDFQVAWLGQHGREWSKLRWETGKRVRGLLYFIERGPGRSL